MQESGAYKKYEGDLFDVCKCFFIDGHGDIIASDSCFLNTVFVRLGAMLNDKEIRHVAKLARLELSDEEVTRFGAQMNDVLEYMDILKEVDVEGVKITNQVTGLSNVMGKDEVKEPKASPSELLDTSELDVDSDQIRVMKTI